MRSLAKIKPSRKFPYSTLKCIMKCSNFSLSDWMEYAIRIKWVTSSRALKPISCFANTSCICEQCTGEPESSKQAFDINYSKVSKGAKIRNRYNQAPHLTQVTNRKVTTSQLDITNQSQEASPLPAGDHKASTNRCA